MSSFPVTVLNRRYKNLKKVTLFVLCLLLGLLIIQKKRENPPVLSRDLGKN